MVAGKPVGVIGVSAEPPLTEHQRSVLIAAAALLAVQVKNAELFQEVRENSVRDGLTGCFNRKHAIEVMDGELRRSRRSQMPLSLVMFDLDFFKDVNDTHGHLCGDAVLAAVGSAHERRASRQRPEVPVRRRRVPHPAARHAAGRRTARGRDAAA